MYTENDQAVEEDPDELLPLLAVPHQLDEAVVDPDEGGGGRHEPGGEHAWETALQQAQRLAEQRVELLHVLLEDLVVVLLSHHSSWCRGRQIEDPW